MHFDTYLPYSQNSSLTLLDAFAGLFSRIRNADEVRLYLQEFTYSDLATDDLRIVERQQNLAQLEYLPMQIHFALSLLQNLYKNDLTSNFKSVLM